jgi:hypothetical protein
MVGTSLPPTSLPKATSLTGLLTAPAAVSASRDEFGKLRREFEAELRTAAGSLPAGERVRVNAYHLRNSVSGNVNHDSPFRWTPWTARRSIGVECVRACLANARLTPPQAGHDVIARLIRRADDERGRPGSLAEWLAGLAVGGRAVVQAEAVAWATQLLTALDWSKLSAPIVGGDRSVVLPSSSQVLLRGRIEVRTRVVSPQPPNDSDTRRTLDGAPSVLFAMMTGRPSPTARTELGLAALTVALDDRHGDVPIRVVGWWPQCGRALVVPVDLALLDHTCQAVVATVRSACPTNRVQPRSAGGTVTRAARRASVKNAPRRADEPIVTGAERAAS